MDAETYVVQESSDMSISSDDDGIKPQKESNVELEHDHGEAQPDVFLGDPKLGMAFDTEDEVREYYNKYAKAKGFGVTRRSSNNDDNGQLKYLTLSCSRYGKTQSSSRNMLKPNPTTGLGCKAKINITRGPDGKFYLSTVILDHNHTLSPHKSRLFRCNKKLDFHDKRRLELNDRAGIRVNKNFNSLVVEANGHENLTFGEKNCRNFLEKTRRLKLGRGDAEAVRDYFVKMQSDNPNFFSVMDLDDESRLRNVFWADARSRAVYETFHDVISFDTTYLTNKYDMPFACFVVVNHHGQSVLLGCALLSNEDTATFVWLFQAWLKCMSNRQPKAIVTDQAKAIQNGVEIVFPESRYRWCLWHIMKKIPEKFGGYDEYDHIKSAIGNAVYDSLTIPEFEVAWMHMLEKYDLGDNEWLKGLYDHRHRWVPAFVKEPKFTHVCSLKLYLFQARSTNLKRKGSSKKGNSSEHDILEQDVMEQDDKVQEPFDLGITTDNLPQGSTTVSFGGSSTLVMPQVLGEYTSMLFQVQQGSTVVSTSPELYFDGTGGLNIMMDQS